MKVVKRDPEKGYLDSWLWVPKKWTNVNAVMSALSIVFTDSYTGNQEVLYLWKEADHHILVPRMLWSTSQLPYEIIDCRPQSFRFVDYTSRIKLDHRPAVINQKEILAPTGDNVQRVSLAALKAAMGGTLQLACVSGDTKVQINRGGKSFTTTIEKAYQRTNTPGRYAWAEHIPTFIRANIGDRIGLQRVAAFIKRGMEQTFELTLEDGKELRLTAEHEVMTPVGYKRLDQLKCGDEVIVEGTRHGSIRKKKLAYKRLGGFVHHPFARYQSRSYVIEEHRAVVEAALNGLSVEQFRARCRSGNVGDLSFLDPAKYHVHHKDENIKNNKKDNLEVLLASEHRAHHQPGYEAFGHGLLVTTKVKSIKSWQREYVYDVVCEDPHHNFVANGIVVHNCGKGKTVVALEEIAQSRVPAIIVLDNTNLLEQWDREVHRLLDVPGGVGYLMSGKDDWKGRGIVLATYHSLAARSDTVSEEFRRYFGRVYFDEGHHVSAPFFSRAATVFPCQRFALTATPERDDGWHIIADMHIGKIVHKDLRPTMKSRVVFYWTGFELDLTDPMVTRNVLDVNGEVHISKLRSFFGKWRPRLWLLMQAAIDALAYGRKVLVLSDSINGVVNLMALWTRGPHADLYSDIPFPTTAEIGAQLTPLPLEKDAVKRLQKRITEYWKWVGNNMNPLKVEAAAADISNLMLRWQQHLVHKKLQSVYEARQRDFVNQLVTEPSTAGFMTFGVPAKTRQKFLDDRQVVFSITKYGKEGLDCPALDTVLVSDLFSSRNGVQQLKGRPTRPKADKKTPLVVFFVDSIGQCRGMEQKLMRHLRQWPHEEGGPIDFDLINYPKVTSCQISTLTQAFGL
jgi:type III restriction/modification enzyme restriction subunit/intein-like protein with splicing domain